jgi:VanZ family protein
MCVSLQRALGLWLPPFALMAIIFLLSDQPHLNSGLGTLDLVLRKAAHFAEYALLCALWWRPLRTLMGARRAALLALAFASAYAALDEYHQTFVEGRSGSPVDWLIDTSGAALAAYLLATRPARRRAAA